ncbi:golgin subfamily A member 6-like protein 26 [Montipora foliosa]|uniref:golgin subfamily A member 6-like protein 26 n=1 Tax=Montipora foliosa TaxID=591990 RepID=UPI0035F1BE53
MDGQCLSVTVVEKVTKLDTLGGYVFLVFLLSLVVGFILGLLLARYILRELEEQYSLRRSKSHSTKIVLETEDEAYIEGTSAKKMGSNRIAPMPVPTKNTNEVAIEMVPTHQSIGSIHSQSAWTEEDGNDQSFIGALSKSSGEEMEVVLQNQDFRSIEIMETSLQFQRNETFLQLLKMILSFLVSKSRITEGFRRDSLAKFEQGLEDINRNAKEEMKAEEQELRTVITDPMELDQAIESLHSKYSKKMNSERIELEDTLKTRLLENTELSEEEAEQIVAKLMMNMAAVDKRLAEEQNRQTMVLQERLARRQAVAQQRVADNQKEKDEFDERVKQPVKNLEVLCKRGKLLENQKERIMAEYQQDLRVLEEKHQQAVLKSQRDLRQKLKRKREQRMKKLEMEQASEKDDFHRKAGQLISEGNMTAEDFLEATHKLNVQHQAIREEEEDRADELDSEELNNLREQLEEKRQQNWHEREEALFEQIRKESNLSSKEAEKLMNKHLEDLEELNERKFREREKQRAMIEEKLQERKMRWEREMEQQQAEQSQMIAEQDKAIKQVLNTQAGLAEELRRQVMLEHDQNMITLNNHLQMTRLRQRKRLEQRLATRRARLAALREEMEKERENQAGNDPEAMKTLSRVQNIEYQAEVKKIEAEHQAALEDLRRRLEAETDEALKEQDERLGKILGKLQVAVARREEIIEKQDEAIRSLEKKLVENMTRSGTLADAHTDRILKQHHKQVDKLNAQIETEKEKQMQKIREKLEAKQLKKARALEAKLYQEKEDQKSKAAQSAGGKMLILLAEQRHKRELEDMEREMQMDLARQLEELNKEMNEQLMADLQEEERKFIATLAENSSATEEELLQTIKSSASEVGLDSKLTKSIAKDVRKRVRSARTPAPDV